MTHLLFAALVLGADDDPAKAVRALADAPSYRFTVQDGSAAAVVGTYQKDSPTHFKADGIEFFFSSFVDFCFFFFHCYYCCIFFSSSVCFFLLFLLFFLLL